MRATLRILAAALALLLLASLGACQKRTQAEHAPTVIPQEFRVGVAWFTQPTTTSELVTGQLPSHQGRIGPGPLKELDSTLARTLSQESSRQYVTLNAPISMPNMNLHESGSPRGLQTWLEIGRKADVDLLFVPQIIHWQERDGGEAGVARGAAIKAEFHLLDIARARLLKRAVFEEEQIGLTDNLLTVNKFFKRRGRWVSATELTQEGMIRAIKEFGL
ncbi:MAG: hypothetical protein LBC79_10635 [Deltaproteobacteria bacterium]|jgi:hypothetical protein|nr:hypothetical protein [Deltaproteobacteria bacterium]